MKYTMLAGVVTAFCLLVLLAAVCVDGFLFLAVWATFGALNMLFVLPRFDRGGVVIRIFPWSMGKTAALVGFMIFGGLGLVALAWALRDRKIDEVGRRAV